MTEKVIGEFSGRNSGRGGTHRPTLQNHPARGMIRKRKRREGEESDRKRKVKLAVL